MASSRSRTFLVAAALLAGTALLTACQDDTAGANSSSSVDSATPAGAAAKSKGVSGTFAGGTVEYLAPGKYIVDGTGKDAQQFFVAEDTKVYGAGTICGEYNPAADTPCTPDDLEKVLKDGSVAADVTMKNGIATTITERPAPDEGAPANGGSGNGGSADGGSADGGLADGGSADGGSGNGGSADGDDTAIDGINKGKGVNGTWFGNVTYLAPGKYTVSNADRTDQQFFIAEDTKIWGTGDICGDEEGQAATECTEEELEAATKGSGVSAEVIIVNGIATTITDDH